MVEGVPTAFETLVAVVLASRPPSWCFGPILFGIGLIHSHSISELANKSSSLFIAALQVFSLSFPLCIIVFGMNDVYDYHTDILNIRKTTSGLEGGVLYPVFHSSVRLAAFLSTVFIFLVSLLTLKARNISAVALLVLLGWQYSAPPLRLKEIPLLDSCSNGLIVFLAWLVGYTFGRGKFSDIPDKVFVLSLCTTGVHALGAAVDLESDIAAGQTTVATFLGQRSTAAFGASTFIAALATVNGANIILNVYLWMGAVIMLTPCWQTSWVHHAFTSIVFWSIAMVVLWFGSKVTKSIRPKRHQTSYQNFLS